MDSNAKVQSLIDQFELMAQVNAAPAAPRTWPMRRSGQPASDNSSVKELIDRLNKQRSRTLSEPLRMTTKGEMKATEVVQPEEELEGEEQETLVAKSSTITPTKSVVYKNLTIKTLSDANTPAKSTYYSAVPRSPSAYSTASTGSLDSLLSSLDMFVPELLQASTETNTVVSKIPKPIVYHSRRSSLPENLRTVTSSKLLPPTSYRRASLSEKPSSTNSSTTISKARSSSLHVPKNPDSLSTPARPRRSSLSAPMAPPIKQTRRFSDSARCRSNSSYVPRYLDYDNSPRFAATKAMNVERRRQLEERNRNLAADRTKHLDSKIARKPRTPEWQGRLDQVRTRLFDDDQSDAARTKAPATRRSSTSSHLRA